MDLFLSALTIKVLFSLANLAELPVRACPPDAVPDSHLPDCQAVGSAVAGRPQRSDGTAEGKCGKCRSTGSDSY